MKYLIENLKKNKKGKGLPRFHWLFKKKYSARYSEEVWVFNPFAFLVREKMPVA